LFNFYFKKMNNVKTSFSIRDLENLSGIKAHTIRIWEKRYNLLEPERTDTNIRNYSLASLQKLLNITLLYNNGYKISKIASIAEEEIPQVVQQIISKNSIKHHSFNSFKMAMVNFDAVLFNETYHNLIKESSFTSVFYDVFIPFLNELGLLWQSDAASPSHEHFITNLIKQKIILNTELLQTKTITNEDKTFVLFLPENEIHDIGLLYLNYELTHKGYKTIYLGPTLPISCLKELLSYDNNLYFISYFTVEPNKDRLLNYIESFNEEMGTESDFSLWLLGYQVQFLIPEQLPKNMRAFKSIENLLSEI
jgi:MerR family transcriptional regulator, light-induced transcriptional regulator